ncbi:MAG: hypothetical protein LBK98_01230 [Peptococcaceae bacterium]|jgi:3D (Asp-Asp-Asp) domain-containing protein|nr:hypothetical protein [Peptococcaceae bacterium]
MSPSTRIRVFRCLPAALFLILCLVGVLLSEYPSLLKAEPTDDELALLPLIDMGCGESHPNEDYSRFLINDSDGLFCLPTTTRANYLMLPAQHFSQIAGCGLELIGENQIRFFKDGQSYLLETGSPWMITDQSALPMPVGPDEEYGYIYVPLRFLCDTLDLDVRWRQKSGTVILDSPGVDPERLALALTAENQALSKAVTAALEEAKKPKLSEAMEVTVTFYFASKEWGDRTKSGTRATFGSVAADPSIPFGTQYYIPSLDFVKEDGIFTVEDRGGAVRGDLIDVYLPNPDRSDPVTSEAFRRGTHKTTAYLVLPPADETVEADDFVG